MMSHVLTVNIQQLTDFIETPSQNLPIEVIEMGVPAIIQAMEQDPHSFFNILESSYTPATYLLANLADMLNVTKQSVKLKNLFDQCSDRLIMLSVHNIFDLERCVAAIPSSKHEIIKTLFANKDRFATLLNCDGDPKKTFKKIAEIYPKYERLLVDQVQLATSEKFSFKLQVVELAKHPEWISQAAIWVEKEWGYLRNLGVTQRKKILTQNINQFYIVTYGNEWNHVVGMFALFDYKLTHEHRKVKEFSYFCIDERLRSIGLGGKVLEIAKEKAMLQGVDLLVLDTLKEELNQFYIKHGAEFSCEGRLFGYPTSILVIPLSMKNFSFSRQQKFFKHVTPVEMQDFGSKLHSGLVRSSSQCKL